MGPLQQTIIGLRNILSNINKTTRRKVYDEMYPRKVCLTSLSYSVFLTHRPPDHVFSPQDLRGSPVQQGATELLTLMLIFVTI